jgi:LysM repeat protein
VRTPKFISIFVIASALSLGLLIFGIAVNRKRSEVSDGQFFLTIFYQPEPTATPAPSITELTTPTPSISVVTRSAPYIYITHTVLAGETLWGLSVRYDVAVDVLQAVNYDIDPERVLENQVLVIPIGDISQIYIKPRPAVAAQVKTTSSPVGKSSAIVAPTSTPILSAAVVSSEGDGLRLRASPNVEAPILTKLPALLPLDIYRKTNDNIWLFVGTPSGNGWVQSQYVTLNKIKIADIANNIETSAVAQNSRSVNAPIIIADDPYISGISGRSRQIYAMGQSRGNQANVFSLIGDSNTEHPAYFKPFDWNNYDLGSFAYLQDTIEFFKGSYARASLSAFGGFNTTKVLDPGSARGGCASGETPLMCEYRVNRPSVALILLGTGDQHSWQGFEGRYRQIIQTTVDQGIVPVLLTKGDDLECKDNNAPCGYINGVITRLAREYDVPLLDNRRAVERLPNRGMIEDGFHYSFPPDNRSAWFSGGYLQQYGYNVRNLTSLRALDAIRRQVIGR